RDLSFNSQIIYIYRRLKIEDTRSHREEGRGERKANNTNLPSSSSSSFLPSQPFVRLVCFRATSAKAFLSLGGHHADERLERLNVLNVFIDDHFSPMMTLQPESQSYLGII